jgi:hypothetical protein
MTPSITPVGHIAPVGTMSRTGDSTASCPSHASRAAVRFDSSIARVSKTSMSLAICDKQLNLAPVPLRSTLGIEPVAGEVYLRKSLASNRSGGLPGRQPEKDGHAGAKGRILTRGRVCTSALTSQKRSKTVRTWARSACSDSSSCRVIRALRASSALAGMSPRPMRSISPPG